MRLKHTLGIVLLAVLHVAFSQSQQQSEVPEPSQAGSLDVVANSVTNLAQKISLAIASPKSKTEIFSPVSIAGALSLLLLGSVGNTQSELMNLMGFKDADITFTDIHKSFGKLFRELVSNEPNLKANVPWRQNDKCNNFDDDDDEEQDTRGSHSKRETRDSIEIKIGNGIFAQEGTHFDKKYQSLTEHLYHSMLQYLDFEHNPSNAAIVINKWVKEQTKGKIPEIVSQLSADTLLVFANTLYFKAEWEEPFLKDGTKPRPFYPNGPNGGSKNVSMMVHGGCFPYYFWKEENVKVIGFPYKNSNTMYILMPMDSDRNKLQALNNKMNAKALNDIISKMEVKTASIQFPKMDLTNSFSLKQVFEQMGVHSIFDRNNKELYRILHGGRVDTDDIFELLEDTKENAIKDLQAMHPDCLVPQELDVDDRQKCEKKDNCLYGGNTCVCCTKKKVSRRQANEEKKPLYVSEVAHKVDVTVNEKGTEGGAVTATLLDRITSQVNFRVNGPFLMVIRDEMTKLPLFYGAVYEPTSKRG